MFKLAKKASIADYVVTFPIKEGSYAETYRVKDANGKNRLLKLIDPAKLNATQRDAEGRALEAEIAKSLSHPNIVGYVESGFTDVGGKDYIYIIFEYISGETLAQFMARESDCSVYDAKAIVKGVLRGLSHMHTLPTPIIHNEITLHNVMLNAAAGMHDAKVIDLGHARYFSQGRACFDKEGIPPFFLAPEAFNGVYSVQSDVFAAGAVLFNLIFGLPPYHVDLAAAQGDKDKERAMIDAQRQMPLFFPSVTKFELDENLYNTLRKALATDPAERFESADEFIRAIDGEIKVERIDNKGRNLSGQGQDPSAALNQQKVQRPKGAGFAAIAGMQVLKDQLQVEVIDALRSPAEYAKYGLTIPNGMLLYGPPGCGKTFFAKHFAEEVGFSFMFITPSSLKSRYVNATQENIAQMFKTAEDNAPTIIFIDEMNELVPNRESDVHEMALSAVNEMLAQMDRTGEKGIFIIGATNFPNMIDPAILRAGRLDKKYYIGTPDFDARKAMFALHLKNRPCEPDLDLAKLAELTDGYVSADLEMIVNDASRLALRRKSNITLPILQEVIAQTKPSLSRSELNKYLTVKASIDKGDGPNNNRPRVGFV